MWAAEGFQRYLGHNFNRYDGVNANERGLYDVTKRGKPDEKLQANEMKAAVNDYYRVLYASDEMYTDKFDHFDWDASLSDAAWISWDSLKPWGKAITYDDVTEDPEAFAKVAKQWFGDEQCYTFSDTEPPIDKTFIESLALKKGHDDKGQAIRVVDPDLDVNKIQAFAQKIDLVLPCSLDEVFRTQMGKEFPQTKDMTDAQRKQFFQVLIASQMAKMEKNKPGITDTFFSNGHLTIGTTFQPPNQNGVLTMAHTDSKSQICFNLYNDFSALEHNIGHELGHYIFKDSKQYNLFEDSHSRVDFDWEKRWAKRNIENNDEKIKRLREVIETES